MNVNRLRAIGPLPVAPIVDSTSHLRATFDPAYAYELDVAAGAASPYGPPARDRRPRPPHRRIQRRAMWRLRRHSIPDCRPAVPRVRVQPTAIARRDEPSSRPHDRARELPMNVTRTIRCENGCGQLAHSPDGHPAICPACLAELEHEHAYAAQRLFQPAPNVMPGQLSLAP